LAQLELLRGRRLPNYRDIWRLCDIGFLDLGVHNLVLLDAVEQLDVGGFLLHIVDVLGDETSVDYHSILELHIAHDNRVFGAGVDYVVEFDVDGDTGRWVRGAA
jgi:hypothetical protein